ncbi:uncharacterized protein ntf4 [Pholidichthys leucotaenia]
MHWLPLVAMVIASALPFPHDPTSKMAATAEDGTNHHRDHGHAAAATDHRFNRSAAQTDFDITAVLRSYEGYATETSRSSQLQSSSGGEDGSRLDRGASTTSKDTSVQKDSIGVQGGLQDSRNRPVSPTWTGHRGPTTVAPPSEGDAESRWTPGRGEEGLGLDAILKGDEMFLDAHPRVLFSPSPSPPEHPPLLLMLEAGLSEEDGEEQEVADIHVEGHGDSALDRSTDIPGGDSELGHPVKRDKRSHLLDRRRGEKSVCESESVWVTDKKTAIDSHGKEVTVLQQIQTQSGPVKQYFYETRCRQAEHGRSRGGVPETGVEGAGCLGVDRKQWRSQCKVKQSYVRALTTDASNRTGWRWIRVDSSCVCVLLSRANQIMAREVLTRKGRG